MLKTFESANRSVGLQHANRTLEELTDLLPLPVRSPIVGESFGGPG